MDSNGDLVGDEHRNGSIQKAAWVTLLTDEKYLPGLAVFATSLLKGSANHKGSRYPLVIMVTPDVSQDLITACKDLGCLIRSVDTLSPTSSNGARGSNLAFAHFANVWTKLRAFEMVEYHRIVLVDSDMLVLQNMDELMEMDLEENQIMATFACTCNPAKKSNYPVDWMPENCAYTPQKHPENTFEGLKINLKSRPTHHLLNSGLVVLIPSINTSRAIQDRIREDPKIDQYKFPDQELLADYFRGKFIPLPYTYNALKKVRGSHPQLWRDEHIKNIHYILDKPWNVQDASILDADDVVTHQWWWNVFKAHPWSDIINKYVVDSSMTRQVSVHPSLQSESTSIVKFAHTK